VPRTGKLTGLINVICNKAVWNAHRRVARSAPALLVRGHLQKVDGVINVVAEQIDPLPIGVSSRSRDLR
jgi:error-prone DNA polymerase